MKNFGLTIFFVGVGVLAGVVVYEVIKDVLSSGQTPVVVAIGGIAIVLGIIITLISLILERIKDSKEENL